MLIILSFRPLLQYRLRFNILKEPELWSNQHHHSLSENNLYLFVKLVNYLCGGTSGKTTDYL